LNQSFCPAIEVKLVLRFGVDSRHVDPNHVDQNHVDQNQVDQNHIDQNLVNCQNVDPPF
jgi:hypothetical protein